MFCWENLQESHVFCSPSNHLAMDLEVCLRKYRSWGARRRFERRVGCWGAGGGVEQVVDGGIEMFLNKW